MMAQRTIYTATAHSSEATAESATGYLLLVYNLKLHVLLVNQ